MLHYENQNPSNVIYALSRKEIEYSNANIKNVLIDIEDEETIKSAASICSADRPKPCLKAFLVLGLGR